jgi:hypothetical protein
LLPPKLRPTFRLLLKAVVRSESAHPSTYPYVDVVDRNHDFVTGVRQQFWYNQAQLSSKQGENFMRILSLLLTLLLPVFGADPAKNNIGTRSVTYEQILPLLIVGEGWSQSLVVQNVDDDRPSVGNLKFYTREGEPWQVDLVDHGKTDTVPINLQPGHSMFVQTVEYLHPQELGWAFVDLDSEGLGDILCQTIYRKRQEGRPDLMTSAVLSDSGYDRMSLYFDNTDWKYAGVAILNSDQCSYCTDKPEFRIQVKNFDGSIVVERTRAFDYGELWWISLIHEFPETIDKRGILVVEPVERFDGEVSGFSLQFTPNGAFTAIVPFEE